MKPIHKRITRLEQNAVTWNLNQLDLSVLTDEDLEILIEIGRTLDEEKTDSQKEIWNVLLRKIGCPILL
jgi:hypothetical protein